MKKLRKSEEFSVLVTRKPSNCFDCPVRVVCMVKKFDIAPKDNRQCLLKVRKDWKLVKTSKLPKDSVVISKAELESLRKSAGNWEAHLWE